MLDRFRIKLTSGLPARPIDYYMLGGLSAIIVLLLVIYFHGVRCG